VTAGDDPGPPSERAPWVTPRFEIIASGGAKVIAAEGQVGDDSIVTGS
jgi:hypothetical protein